LTSCKSRGNFGIWSGWDGVGTAAVTLVGSIAYFTRSAWQPVLATSNSTAKCAPAFFRRTSFHYTGVLNP